MGFYTIYIDDSASASDLNDPLFLLQAALVRADSDAWKNVECVCLATLEEIRRIPGLEKVDRLHICEMVQRRGGYKNVGYDKIFSWIEQVLVCAKQNDVMYVNVPLPRKFFEIMPDDHLGPVSMDPNPYEVSEPELLRVLTLS